MHYKKTTLIALIISLSSTISAHAEAVTLKDKKGNMIIVSPLRENGDKIIVKRMHDGKEFALSPDILEDESKNRLIKAAEKLDKIYPKLKITASIGEKNDDPNKIPKSHRIAINITAKVSVTNTNHSLECPSCAVTMIFIGKEIEAKKAYQILSTQSFKIKPTTKGTAVNVEPFINNYNDKGAYRSGYKYETHLIIITDPNGAIIETTSPSAIVKKALREDSTLAKKFLSYQQDDILNKSMKIMEKQSS